MSVVVFRGRSTATLAAAASTSSAVTSLQRSWFALRAFSRDDLVLDIGAGTGVLRAPLVRAGARVVAVEIDTRLAEG